MTNQTVGDRLTKQPVDVLTISQNNWISKTTINETASRQNDLSTK